MIDPNRSPAPSPARNGEQAHYLLAQHNRMLGLWLAERLDEPDPKAFAETMVIADLDEPDEEAVIRKIMSTIAERNAPITEDQVRAKLAELHKTMTEGED